MRQRQSGLNINASSVAAEAGLAYNARKAALERLTKALRLELDPFGVQACSIQPGGTRTDINRNLLATRIPA